MKEELELGFGFLLFVCLFVVLFCYIELQVREKGLKDEQLSVWYGILNGKKPNNLAQVDVREEATVKATICYNMK